jgi:hypothetical protein
MEIDRLEGELQSRKDTLKRVQGSCSHEWEPTLYEPETYMEPVFSHYEEHGSDPTPVYTYRDKTKDRWSRTCKKCSKKEFSYSQKAVKYEPSF